MVLYKMIAIQLGAGTFCTWQPVPAAVKNSWKAEAPSRAVNIITAVSTGASLLCMNKIMGSAFALGIYVVYCTKIYVVYMHCSTQPRKSAQNYFTFLCFLKPI